MGIVWSKMRKPALQIFAFIFAMVTLMAIGMKTEAKEIQNKIQSGIYVDDIDVSGMTVQEATTRVNEHVASMENEEITLNAADGNKVVIKAGDLGLVWKNQDIIEEAGSYGREGNVVQRYKALKDLEHENKNFEIEFEIDKAVISQIITDQCTKYDVGAVDATLTRENGVFVVKAGQTGYKVDVAGSTEAVYTYLSTEWNHEAGAIDLVTEVAQPRGTEEELSKVKDVLGTFSTKYTSSGKARSTNVSNGCNLISGKTLYPGDTFSTYEAVSPFTAENGYYMAGSYLNGMVVESLGGGICQVSTTLYNAVLRAELEVTERFNHSMIVSYVDKSADAAISGTSKDFKFTNSTDAPIYIEGTTSPDKVISFTIYGAETRPANRTVEYVSEELSRTDPSGEKIIADASLPVGSINVQSAHIGYTAKLWKVVKEGGVEVSRTEVNKSSYQLSPRTATVGVSTPNPEVYNAMQAAIATGSIDYVKNIVASYNAAQAAPPPVQTQADADTAAESAPLQ